jgi:outer membrane protein TolC
VVASGEISSAPDDLHAEAPLAVWERSPEEAIPAIAAAAANRRSALAAARASKLALLPTLSATAVERITNASAFLMGHNSVFSITLTLGWRFDVSTVGALRAQAAAAALASVQEDRARLGARDQIHEAWQRVRAGIAKSRAARAQTEAARLAARLAVERYRSGAGTQLDVVQAQRDAYAAEVARIQADADLAFARALLRLSAGQPLNKDA